MMHSVHSGVQGSQKKMTAGLWIIRLLWEFLAAVLTVLLIITFAFQIYCVEGPSMLMTLHDNERMLTTKFDYLFGDPQRFHVVVCRYPYRENESFVKRIIGVPGDTLSIRDGRLYINGEAHVEPYASYPEDYVMEPVVVGEEEYFVMGDNRMISNDSRNPDVGPIPRSEIIGHVRAVIWPPGEIRTIR